MHHRLLDQLQHETPVAMHISRRDLVKNLAGFSVGALIAAHAGMAVGAVVLAVVVLVLEYLSVSIRGRSGDRSQPWVVLTQWAINVLATGAYLGPAVMLAGQPSIALLLVGFIYLFGVSVHVSNTFVALPVYNWSQMVPVLLAAAVVMLVAQQTRYLGSSDLDWGLALAVLLIYAFSTIITINSQKDTQRQLDAARADAQTRLRALEHMSRHDTLTGLLNRQAFDEALADLLSADRTGQQVAVLLIDLDGFKPLNDSYGHAAGDAVLMAAARRIARAAQPGGLAARLGGDEFAVALPGTGQAAAAMQIARTLRRDLARDVVWQEKTLVVGASIGVALGGAGGGVSDLCAAADQAMYRAKGTLAGTMLYQQGAFPRRLTLDDRRTLAEALASRAIRPFYQPKVRLADGGLIGLEALARWQHPVRGLLTPGHFLDDINQLGLQGDFMMAITAQALADVAAMLAAGLDPGQVSVNMPEVALATSPGRAELLRLIEAEPAAMRHLTLEITEDVFIARNADAIRGALAEFRAMGLRVSLDDFGTGFASFQHLRQLPFDELKIGPGFVADLGQDPMAEVLVKGFLDIARGLGADVIVEGVETEAQRQALLALGATQAQGWLFGKAQPLNETMLRLALAAPPRLQTGTGGSAR